MTESEAMEKAIQAACYAPNCNWPKCRDYEDPGRECVEFGEVVSTAIAKYRELHPGEGIPDDLRALGWAVAVHNDYRLNGAAHTFWLLTHADGRYIKGEGATDADALNACRAMLAASPSPASTGLGQARCTCNSASEMSYCKHSDECSARLKSRRATGLGQGAALRAGTFAEGVEAAAKKMEELAALADEIRFRVSYRAAAGHIRSLTPSIPTERKGGDAKCSHAGMYWACSESECRQKATCVRWRDPVEGRFKPGPACTTKATCSSYGRCMPIIDQDCGIKPPTTAREGGE